MTLLLLIMISVHILLPIIMCVCMHVVIATFIAIDCRYKLRLLLCAFLFTNFKTSLCCFQPFDSHSKERERERELAVESQYNFW